MTKKILSIWLCCAICIFLSSCDNGEKKSKETVKAFCEAYKGQMLDKAKMLYPKFSNGVINVNQVDLDNLTVSKENVLWKVDDGVNHIFYVTQSDGKYVIKDSRNIINSESEDGEDIKAADFFGMVSSQSTDLERMKAYSKLKDGSDFIEYLKRKYPEALVYGITIDNVEKIKMGKRGVNWLSLIVTFKSGLIKPLASIHANIIGKNKNGNSFYISDIWPIVLDAHDTQTSLPDVIDLDYYPGLEDVEVKLIPPSKPYNVSDIGLIMAYGVNVSNQDYKEYLKTNN